MANNIICEIIIIICDIGTINVTFYLLKVPYPQKKMWVLYNYSYNGFKEKHLQQN